MKYWAYVNNEILGPFEKEKLFEIPDFSTSTLLCPQTPVGETTQDWKEAANFPEIAALLNSPQAPSFEKKPGQSPSGPAPEPKPEPAPESKPEPSKDIPTEMKPEPLKMDTPAQKADSSSKEPSPEPAAEKPEREETNAPERLKPKPLSPTPLNAGEAAGSPPPADNFTVNRLHSLKESESGKAGEQIPEESSKEPSESPDIEKEPRIVPPPSEGKEETPAQEPLPQPFQQPPAREPSPEPLQQSPARKSSPEPEGISGKIFSKLDRMEKEYVTKDDFSEQIGPLNQKLAEIGDLVGKQGNEAVENRIREISEKLQNLENLIEEIKLNLSVKQYPPRQQPSSQPREKPSLEESQPAISDLSGTQRVSAPFDSAESKTTGKSGKQQEEAAEIQTKKNKEENQIVDEGSDQKGKSPVFKKILKIFLGMILVAGILIAGVIILRNLNIIDLTRFLPSSGQTSVQQTQAPAPVPSEPDITPEVVYFARTFSGKNKTGTLENEILKDAVLKNADANSLHWTAVKSTGPLYSVKASMSVIGGNGTLSYEFEANYANMTLKPANAAAAGVFSGLMSEKPPKPPENKKPERAAPKKQAVKTQKKKPVQKPKKTVSKPAKKAEPVEEYEYVVEEDDFLLPGVPMPGGN